jgi:hypothetical protein
LFSGVNFSEEDFMRMTDDVLRFLQRSGFKAETRDKDNTRLTAFRRNLYFPESTTSRAASERSSLLSEARRRKTEGQLLFELGLSGHKAERFFIKVEAQDQGYSR